MLWSSVVIFWFDKQVEIDDKEIEKPLINDSILKNDKSNIWHVNEPKKNIQQF